MKKLNVMIAAVGMCAALSGAAMAEGEGPFNTKQDVVNYWSGHSTSGAATQIFLDGFKIYERGGFGPAFVQQYFSCGEYGIRTKCTGDWFSGFATVSDARAGISMGLSVYVDHVLKYKLDPYYYMDLKTCYGEMSYYGRVKYFVAETVWDGFGPPFPGQSCFQ
jgi:hypothetical protein